MLSIQSEDVWHFEVASVYESWRTLEESEQAVSDLHWQLNMAGASEMEMQKALARTKSQLNDAIVNRETCLTNAKRQFERSDEEMKYLKYNHLLFNESVDGARNEAEWLQFIWKKCDIATRQKLEPLANSHFRLRPSPVGTDGSTPTVVPRSFQEFAMMNVCPTQHANVVQETQIVAISEPQSSNEGAHMQASFQSIARSIQLTSAQ